VDECKPLPSVRISFTRTLLVTFLARLAKRSVCDVSSACASLGDTIVWRRKLNLKAKFESGSSHLSLRQLDPGAFNVGLIGSTCTA